MKLFTVRRAQLFVMSGTVYQPGELQKQRNRHVIGIPFHHMPDHVDDNHFIGCRRLWHLPPKAAALQKQTVATGNRAMGPAIDVVPFGGVRGVQMHQERLIRRGVRKIVDALNLKAFGAAV